MKILGHPVHIGLIPFPAALYPMGLVCYFLYLYITDTSFGDAAFYAPGGGVLAGWLAVFSGAVAATHNHAGWPWVIKKALLQGSINTLVLAIYTVMGSSLFNQYLLCQQQAALAGALNGHW